jgi:hypothetical protein
MDLLERLLRCWNRDESCNRHRIDLLCACMASVDMVDGEWRCDFIALGLVTAVLALGPHNLLATCSLDFYIGHVCGISFWRT